MATGTVKWFRDAPQKRSFGFITPDDHSKDVFFFSFNRAAERAPQAGQRIEYTPEMNGTKGPVAREWKLLP